MKILWLYIYLSGKTVSIQIIFRVCIPCSHTKHMVYTPSIKFLKVLYSFFSRHRIPISLRYNFYELIYSKSLNILAVAFAAIVWSVSICKHLVYGHVGPIENSNRLFDYSEPRRDETDILTAISGPSFSTTPVFPACRPHCPTTPLSEVSGVFPRSTDRFW